MTSTPLLDFFRRGEVAHDIRLLAARGALAPRAHEQLGLLTLLVSDSDPEIARAAEATLAAVPRESLAAFLARADASAEIRAFFAARGIEPAALPSGETDQPLIDTTPEPAAEAAPVEQGSEDQQTAMLKIAALSVAQRISLAMKGTREERAILIRDPNKIVAVAVLSSPKLTETEVESIAKMANVSDEILRIIGHTRAWVKNYPVMLALTKNPKTPVALSMNLLPRLNDKDLRMLSTDRNVPEILRVTARKKIVIDK
ncbi:MAG TPA: hypothetical protein VGQ10_10310 [Vicinamibacterales bacterium]|jgi:hypothetical protein|nr:hypothetical protein [Vicinamibacterales bacterium]